MRDARRGADRADGLEHAVGDGEVHAADAGHRAAELLEAGRGELADLVGTGLGAGHRGASIRWSSGSVLACARRARPITSRWISLVPSKIV